MSTFIKGMKVPKCCFDCPFNPSSLYCYITHSEIDRDDEYYDRLPDCPIVELPEHHGRLVDADYLEKHAGEWLSTYNLIDSAETIIAAE